MKILNKLRRLKIIITSMILLLGLFNYSFPQVVSGSDAYGNNIMDIGRQVAK